jgi:peroxiredoxin
MKVLRFVQLAAMAGILALAGACSNPGAGAVSKPEAPTGGRSPAPPAPATPRPWYADRLEKLGFFVFPAPVDVGDFSVETLSGGSYKLSAAKGKIVLLNFWATWCPPCRVEMPSIQALWDKTKDRPFTIIAVSIDDDIGTVKTFIKEHNYTYPVYYDQTKQLGTDFNASSIPTTYIIDKRGRAIAGTKGSREYDSPEILALISELASR